MENMKKIAFLILLIVPFSCTRENIEDGDGLPYYEFTQVEKNQLIKEPKVGDEVVFKNQDNELLKFVVGSSKTGKATYTTVISNFLGSYATDRFHYDSQEIEFWSNGQYTTDRYQIKIQKYPIDCNYNVHPPISGSPTFYGYFTFPLWNGYRGTDPGLNTISIDFNKPTTTLSFNGKTYTKVCIFLSNRTEVLIPSIALPTHPRNVHVIYYDFNAGIIGFDDLIGKNWRLE
ncbi:MAG: hypothetical protein CFE24_01005 [Flavobacterium sp. BFFFF2]|nr:MAG: hypothetical protein CFE24_01005 [Flavobacterium sp. BFFFF2]